MRHHLTRSVTLFVLLATGACDDGGLGGRADGGGAADAGPGVIDAGAAAIDAPGPDAPPPPTACRVEVVATSPECHEDCEVRLFLPDGSRYCTLTCASTQDCTPYGSALTCSTEVGTCMPSCSDDAACLGQGFPRCHPVGSFCDTLPACQHDQLCLDNGLTMCVIPGNYCQ
jgi:hypothetical protein